MDNSCKSVVDGISEKYKKCGIKMRTDYNINTSIFKQNDGKKLFEAHASGSKSTNVTAVVLVGAALCAVAAALICHGIKMKSKYKQKNKSV